MQVREHLVEDWSGRHARQFEHQVFRPVAGGCEACNALGIHHDGVKFPAILVAGVQETGLVVKFPLSGMTTVWHTPSRWNVSAPSPTWKKPMRRSPATAKAMVKSNSLSGQP